MPILRVMIILYERRVFPTVVEACKSLMRSATKTYNRKYPDVRITDAIALAFLVPTQVDLLITAHAFAGVVRDQDAVPDSPQDVSRVVLRVMSPMGIEEFGPLRHLYRDLRLLGDLGYDMAVAVDLQYVPWTVTRVF
jgi:hypothetical protein